MKKTVWILIAALAVAFLTNHAIRSEYRFPNEGESIVSIQLMNRTDEDSGDPADFTLIRELTQEEFPAFMNAVYALDTKKGGTPPRWGYGEFDAIVTYANGDVEILGTYCIELVKAGQALSGVGTHYFADAEAFEELILEYAAEP